MAFTFNLSACFDYDVALCVEYINFFIINKSLSQKLNRLRPLFMMHIFIHHMFYERYRLLLYCCSSKNVLNLLKSLDIFTVCFLPFMKSASRCGILISVPMIFSIVSLNFAG